GDTIAFFQWPLPGFVAYEPYYARDLTQGNGTSTPDTFNLATCITPGPAGSCAAVGPAIPVTIGTYEQSEGPGLFRTTHALTDTADFGTGLLSSAPGGEYIMVERRAGYMWIRQIRGASANINALLSDVNARLATDNWSPATGSQLFTGTSPLSGSWAPKYSL